MTAVIGIPFFFFTAIVQGLLVYLLETSFFKILHIILLADINDLFMTDFLARIPVFS